MTGGIPIPAGALTSVDNVRLLGAGNREIPCQVTKHAVWPDGSIKWVLVDTVLPAKDAQALTLEFGQDVRRAAVADPLTAALDGGDAKISGGGFAGVIKKSGGGVIDELAVAGKPFIAADKPAAFHIDALRIPDATSGQALPVNHYVCRDTNAKIDAGKVQIESVTVESPGPIRATIAIRGFVLLPHFGETLPDEVKQREPAGRIPFTTRLSFFKGCGAILGQNQIVFSGEPDCDFIARWGIELPGRAGPHGTLILEPGVELQTSAGKSSVSETTRLCFAPIQGGFAMIRHGWQNRPAAISQRDGSAWIDFWPREAGLFDLRRYAREWAVGESGDVKSQKDLDRYARFAARGAAKTHSFVIYAGSADVNGAAPAIAKTLADRAVLVAPPSWYGASQALGAFVPEQTSGEFAEYDAATRRRLDFFLFNQDLYRWHGKINYGFFQTRFGEMHRHDRWEVDYGRWALALNDGGGRAGHVLMLQYLRTLDRRYLEAGEAYNRINYDTNMIHTQQHLENAKNWWSVMGCSHRHNVQPFGCPYGGMRGSYPGGQRILYLLTGDGAIGDGLEIVADASFQASQGQWSRLGNSGGSDGQGSAANALLWKYETTGDKKYLDGCRTMLDRSNLIPPQKEGGLGYGPSFGLFNAAGEYADISGDKAFQDRVVALAQMGAKDKEAKAFLYAIAMGCKYSKDEALKTRLAALLKGIAGDCKGSLAELPEKTWPGHAGFRTVAADFNALRDAPLAMGQFVKVDAAGSFPKPIPAVRALPADAPADWHKPGGAQTDKEAVPAAAELLKLKPGSGGGQLSAGAAKWTIQKSLADSIEVNGASPLAAPIAAYVELSTPKDGDGRLSSKVERFTAEVSSVGASPDGALIAEAKAGAATLVIRMRAAEVDGVPSVRVEAACQTAKGGGTVASWGLLLPCKMGPNAHALQTTAPGRFRLERCRFDQNDERMPSWLTSETRFGEGATLWPKWRQSGISVGPGAFYRAWRANRADVTPVFCDQGEGPAAWFDFTDRGAAQRWGVTARVLRSAPLQKDLSRQAVRLNFESGVMEVQFHDASAEPLSEAAANAGLAGAADIIFHDGWRAPLSKPELTAAQYEKFLNDLDYGENYGLFALRFCLSDTHKVKGRAWVEKMRDHGVEPREVLYGMQARDGLAAHCGKLGVQWDADDVEGSVRRVVEHYRK